MEAQKLLEELDNMNPLIIQQVVQKVDKDNDHFDSLKIKSLIEKGIVYPKPILTIDNEPLIFPHTVNVIQGSQGSNKSFLASHIAAAFLNPHRMPPLLNMDVKQDGKYILAYLDTERPTRDQFPAAMNQTIQIAGLPGNIYPDDLKAGSLKKYPRELRLEKTKEFIANIRTERQHIILIIDVITDAMKSFNDLAETNTLMDELNNITENENITVIGIIHENPDGTKKARGHIGTEFVNKATTVISIGYKDYDSDILALKIVKNRLAKRQKEIYIKRCPNTNHLVFLNEKEIEFVNCKDKIKLYDLAEFLIPRLMEKNIPTSELLTVLEDEFDASEKTIRGKLKELIDNQQILREKGCELRLKKGKKNSNIYSIQPIRNELGLD